MIKIFKAILIMKIIRFLKFHKKILSIKAPLLIVLKIKERVIKELFLEIKECKLKSPCH